MLLSKSRILGEHDDALQPTSRRPDQASLSTRTVTHRIEQFTARTALYWPFLSFYLYQYTTKRFASSRRPSSTIDPDNQYEDTTTVTECRILPAYWLRLKAFAFQSMHSKGRWKYTFRSIRVLRYSHPVFDAIYLGQDETVKSYVKDGLVSINDTAPTGCTLLHVSFPHCTACSSV
jgi:hypothetical protein